MKLNCMNDYCRYNGKNGKCMTDVTIDETGRCSSFQLGIVGYLCILWEAVGNENFIRKKMLDENPSLRASLCWILECYKKKCRIVHTRWMEESVIIVDPYDETSGNRALGIDDVTKDGMDMDRFAVVNNSFLNGLIPDGNEYENYMVDQESCTFPKGLPKEFGWLSPSGEFTESPLGEHESGAEKICKKRNFMEEFFAWKKKKHYLALKRDFLTEVKGYCLIHNPSGYGAGYHVEHEKPFTKQQKDFLFAYFWDMGMYRKAKEFTET